MEETATYQEVVEVIQERLEDGVRRISDVPCVFRRTWWPEGPSVEQCLLSDYSMPTASPDLDKIFREEVNAISEFLEKIDRDSQQGEAEPAKNIMASVNGQAKALGIWDNIAFPIRREGDIVFRILAPRDVMGSPIIQKLHVDDYIRGASMRTARDAAHSDMIERQLRRWRTASLVLGLLLLLGVILIAL